MRAADKGSGLSLLCILPCREARGYSHWIFLGNPLDRKQGIVREDRGGYGG